MRHLTILLALTAGCTKTTETDVENEETEETREQEPFAEVRAQGVDRYMGVFTPTETFDDGTGGTAHVFPAAEGGPMCMYGGDFHTMTRSQDDENLVVFLQGGGLCYSELCLAIGSGGTQFPNIDILSSDPIINPVSTWNQVYVPYCDGSLFGGDVDVDDDGDGTTDRYQHGLMNISAALDVASTAFPSPERVFLAGSSGGGYGTIIATMLARWTWPDAEVLVFNDAGVGVAIDDEPEFIRQIIDEFDAASIIPASQTDLLDGGHLAPLIGWQLSEDPMLSVSAYSSARDYVISQMYLKVNGERFENALRQQLGQLQQDWPGRFQYFISAGSQHTTLLGDPSGFLDPDSPYAEVVEGLLGGMTTTAIGDVTITDWVDDFVYQPEAWTSHSD